MFLLSSCLVRAMGICSWAAVRIYLHLCAVRMVHEDPSKVVPGLRYVCVTFVLCALCVCGVLCF